MTPPPRDSNSDRPRSGRRAASANPSPVAIACFVALILALGVGGWAASSKKAAAEKEKAAEIPAPTADPFAGVTREAPPGAPAGRARIKESNRAPAGLLEDPIWVGATQIAQDAYALRDLAEDAKASEDWAGYSSKAVAARESFGTALDASRNFEDRIIDQYGENDRQVMQVAKERNKWIDQRAKYRKVKSSQ